MITIDNSEQILNIVKDRLSILYTGTNIKDFVRLELWKDNKGLSVIFLKTNLMFKLAFLKDKCRMVISDTYKDFLPTNTETYTSHSYKGCICVDMHTLEFLERLDDFYKKFCENCSNTSVGCCSHYVECSDALHCVNLNIETSFSCAYRQNLNNGRIFYGKNRNI